jgi:hypothetical protein
MIDVNKITSTLAKLPDQQLQQYAQMHKNDPYIMALAMSESNRRKEMRAAGQGSMQEQPKVVDQMVAEMAPQQMPEDQGIGQLPAGEMNFAGGGIIAFADGGDVERFNGSQSQFVQDVMGIPQQYTEYQQRIREADAIKAQREKEMAQRRQDELAARQKTSFFNYVFGSPEREAEGKAELAQLATTPVGAPARSGTMPEPGYTRPGMLYDPRLNTPPTQPTQPTQPVVAAPKADTTRRAGPGAGPAAPIAGPKQPPQAGLGDLATTYADILKKQDFKDPAEERLSALEKKERAAAEETKAALLRDQAKFDDAYKGREKRLSDRELDIGKQKGTNTGLALLNAGLAIMSTPGGLATAIGKGAQVGTAQFAAGLDKIRSAQERLDDARDKMEDLKLNRAEMSAKEIRAAEKDIRNVGIDAEKRGIDGIRMAADVNRKTADTMFKAAVDVGVNRERLESAEKISGNEITAANARSAAQIAATLNTPDRILFDQLLKKNDNDAVKALEAFKVAKGDKFDVRTSYADYLKAFAGKEGLTPPMSMGAYAGQFGATLPR